MIKLTDNLEINKPAPADDRLGVFASVAEANSYIHEDRRFLGLKVLIDNAGTAEEYWYESGITDGDLVIYSSGGGGGGVPYSGATQDVNLGEHGISAGFFQADTTPTGTGAVGRMIWNDTDGTMNLGLKGGNVTLQIGQKEVARVVNGTGTNLLASNYQAVRITGAQGQRLQVLLAQANNDINSATTIGLVAENINNNQQGFITTGGQITGLNTSGSLQGEDWNDGDILYLSPTTAGALTNVKPVAPSHSIVIGWVEYAHQNNGKIFVKVDNGYEINELHNVSAQSPSNRDGLFFNSSTQLWESRAIVSDDLSSGINASKIANGNVSDTEFQYLDGVTSAIQTQLNGKEATITAGTTSQYFRGDKTFQTLPIQALANAGSVSITITATGSANLQTLTGHAFTIPESQMPVGSIIQINGMCERIATGSGVGSISYDINGTKRYITSPSGHQYQYQITLYRDSSTSIRMMGGGAGGAFTGAFGSANQSSTTATITAGGNIVFQLSGYGSVINDQIAYRFFKAILIL